MAEGRALWLLFVTRVRVFLREPAALFWTFGFPLLTAIALGIAFRTAPAERVAVALVGGDATLERALRADPLLEVRAVEAVEAAAALRTGRVALTVEAGDPVRLRYDPTRPDGRLARLAVAAALERASGRAPAWRAVDALVTEPGSRYIDFLIPGLIGMTILNCALWGIGWSVVDARARQQLKRLAATPMRRSHYLMAFIIGHVVLIAGVLAALLLFARIAFAVRVFGSLGALAVVTLVGGLSFAGLAVLVCSRTASNEVLSGLTNAVALPMFVTSGVFFASSRFPDLLQPVIRVLPLTAFNHALRRVMTDGAGLVAVAPDLGLLALWGVVTFALGLRAFRWV